MNSRPFVLCLLFILCVSVPGCAMGMADSARSGTITGTVRVVGNAPLTHLVVTVEEGKNGRGVDYLIAGPLENELRGRYQGKKVTLEGEMCGSPLPQFRKCFRPSKIVEKDYR